MIGSLARRGEVVCKLNVVRKIHLAQMARNYMTYISFHFVFTQKEEKYEALYEILTKLD